MGKVNVGSAWPLGSSVTPNGVNFSIAAPHAKNVKLLIFQNEYDDFAKETISLDQKNKSGDYWHVELEGLTEGTLYGYNISINEHSSTSEHFVLDPCARAITGWVNYIRYKEEKGKKGYSHCLKGVVTKRDYFDFKKPLYLS